jgi:PAS domain S-box-containing protein
MLARTNRAVSHCRSREELFGELCRIAVEAGQFLFAWVGVPEGNGLRRVTSAGNDGGYIAEVVITLDPKDARSQGPTSRVVRTGERVVLNDYLAAPEMAPWYAIARRVGVAASAAFPLKEQGRVVAVLNLYAGGAGFFTDELLATLDEIPPSVSYALDAFVQEEARQRDEAELRMRDRAMAAVSQGIVITDARRQPRPIVYVSPGFEQITGYTAAELLGRDTSFLVGKGTDSATFERLEQSIRVGRGCAVELLSYRKDGGTFWQNVQVSPVVGADGQVTHMVGVCTDVTARRDLEAQFRQAQKMEAVGQLAAGIAHDFNNVLSVILAYTSLMIDRLKPSDPMRVDLEQVRRAGDRAAALTRQLLVFSRRQSHRPIVLDLGERLTGMESMLRHLLGEDTQLSIVTSHAPGWIQGDSGQLEQVVMNLVVNARDAMPSGGKLTLETTNVALDETYAAAHPGVAPGPYVRLTVTDTGVGMDAATRERLFEPFFTTKEEGKGTGLGLSTVFGIVKQSEGHIQVESEPGQGTTFKIHFPRATQAVLRPTPAIAAASTLRGTETILVVDDSEPVRATTCAILRHHGYDVLDAQNGGEALLLCEQHQGPIQLLLTDVRMPRMSGVRLAERLLPLRPGLKVLFLSGDLETADRPDLPGVTPVFLQKPILPDDLVRKVREVIDGGPQ